MTKKFQPLDYSRGWDDYWRDHPQGYSPQEQMINWTGQLNAMIDFYNEYFDEDLTEYAANVMEGWYVDGRLDNIINETLFDTKADKTTVNALVENLSEYHVNLSDFGVVNENVDIAPVIREAVAYLEQKGGGTLFIPKGTFKLESTVVFNGKTTFIPINNEHICIKGAGTYNTLLSAKVAADSMIAYHHSTGYLNYERLEEFTLRGESLVNYCVFSMETYLPYFAMTRVNCFNGTEACAKLQVYVAVFNHCIFQGSRIGLWTLGTDGVNPSTSTAFISCYALSLKEAGFKTTNLRYSTYINCAVDHLTFDENTTTEGAAYSLTNAMGVSFVGCGCEGVSKAFYGFGVLGLSIDTFYGRTSGSDAPADPIPYMFEIGQGANITIKGVRVENMKQYSYLLGLTGSGWGSENITILDDCIQRANTYFVPNYQFARPVKFLRDDETRKNETVTMSVDDLPAYLKLLEYKTVNHVLTIQLNDGVQTDLTSGVNHLVNIGGTGKIVIQGNVANNSAVVLHGAYDKCKILNCSATIEFKNLTINSRYSNAYSRIVNIVNSKNVIFNNIKFDTSTVYSGAAIDASDNSKVKLINGTVAIGVFNYQGTLKTYTIDASSELLVYASAIPLEGSWSQGTKIINLAPTAGGFIGWVCTATGVPGTWKGYGLIEA